MRKKISAAPTWLKILAGIFLLFVILIVGGNIYLKNLANKRFKEIVLDSSDSLYRVEYDKLRINLLTGNLLIYNFKLIPDTNVFHVLSLQHRAPLVLASGEVSLFTIKGLQWWNYLSNKRIIADQIAVSEPHISLLRYRTPEPDTSKGKLLDVYTMLSKHAKDLRIGSLLLKNASVTYEYSDTLIKRRALLQFEKLGVFIDNLHIDLIKPGDSTKNIFADEYLIKLEQYRIRTGDSLYWMVWKDVEYNSRKQEASIASFAIEPRYDEKDFWKRLKERKERFDMKLEKIKVEGVQGITLVNDGKLVANRIQIGDGRWEIFQNKTLPLPAADKKNICLSQKLKHIKFPLLIDTFEIAGFNLHYKEFNPRSGQVGHLYFNNVKGKVFNITNTEHDIRKNSHMRIFLSANFMDDARLKTEFDFLLNAADGKFSLDAEMNKISATQLNKASKALAKVEVDQGTINKLVFHTSGNENSTTGNIDFLYQDLKVNILEADPEDGELQKKDFKSFLANTFIIKDANPSNNDDPRRALNITTQRHPKKGYFNMVWRNLFEGLKEIITAGKMNDKKAEKKGKKSS